MAKKPAAKAEDEEKDKDKGKEEEAKKGAAEGGDAPAEGAAEEKKGLNIKKIILFGVLPLFILIGAGAGLYFTGTLDKLLGKEPVAEEGTEGEHGAEAGKKDDGHGKEKKDAKKDSHGKKDKKDDGHGKAAGSGAVHGSEGAYFIQMPNMLVNLSSTDGQPRYLRLSVQLEVETEDDAMAIEAVMPRVVDQFQTYLRELRIKDLRGSAGIYRLQLELLNRVNAAAYPTEVKDVLFQEILIQ